MPVESHDEITADQGQSMVGRIGCFDERGLSLEQRHVYEMVEAGPRGYVPRVIAALLDAPVLAECVQAVGSALRFCSDLPAEVREFAILSVAARVRSGYEWSEHVQLARVAGVTGAEAQALLDGDDAKLTAAQRDIKSLCARLLGGDHPGDELAARLIARLGRRGLTELTVLVGYYALIANGLRVAGVDDPLPKSVV